MDNPVAVIQIPYKLVNDDDFETEVKVYRYSDKSVAITSSEHFGKAFKEQLSGIGSFNKKLRIGVGWIFAGSKYPALQALMDKIAKFEVKGEIPVDYSAKESKVDGPLGPMPMDPALVSNMKQIIHRLSLTKETEKNIFIDGTNKYVWGTSEKVDGLVKDMGLNPYITFTTLSHKFVISK